MHSNMLDSACESSGRQRIVDRLDPEDRPVHNKAEQREKGQDKTLADSFPASDPPSSLPNPENDEEQSWAANANKSDAA